MPRSDQVKIVTALQLPQNRDSRLKTQARSSRNFHRKYHAPFIHFEKNFIFRTMERLCEHARAASFNGVNLGLSPGKTAEARGELSTIEELADLGLDGAQGGASGATDGAVEGGATERAVLLSLSTVGSERVRERAGGRGGVDARRVVD